MHAIEKILAKHSGRDRVVSGEIITADIDFAEINDLYLQTIYSFREMGGEKVWDRDKAAFVFDHYAPPPLRRPATTGRCACSGRSRDLPIILTSMRVSAIRLCLRRAWCIPA